MLSLTGGRNVAFCDRLSRRSFLRLGSAGIGSLGTLTLADVLKAESESGRKTTNSVVMIYLCGGPTQYETFDPKPMSPVEIRGSFSPIATRLPGVQFCELLPELSRMNDRFSVVRTLVGMQNRHESFQCYTGRPGGRPGDNEPPGFWPSFGSVASRVLGPADGMVPYVDASPSVSYGPYRNAGLHDASGVLSWPGFTGRAHVPFRVEGEVKQDLVLNGINIDRLHERRTLLESIGDVQRRLEDGGLDDFQRQAFGLLTSSQLAQALDIEREDAAVRAKYGELQKTDPSFGGAPQDPQRLLLARRLVEAGVRVVTVAFGAWDWHSNREGTIEYLSKKYLPVFDRALATFLQDLDERGLLASTAVVVWGEFGRTPRINGKGGRDHWNNIQSVLLAGGGIRPGQIVGQSDRSGGVPAARPVHVQEVFATLYRTLGIDVSLTKIPDFGGRPQYLVDEGRRPLAELA